MTKRSFAWVGSLTLGALLMYLLDPTTGRRRRALLRDRAMRFVRDTADAATGLACDLSNRASGVRARLQQLQQRGAESSVDDTVLEARVRSSLGHVTSNPGAIQVTSVSGVVTLTGPVVASEHDAVCRTVSRVPGVAAVEDRLTLHESAASVSGLQSAANV